MTKDWNSLTYEEKRANNPERVLQREGQRNEIMGEVIDGVGASVRYGFGFGCVAATISSIIICTRTTNVANAAIQVGIITGYVSGITCGIVLACSALEATRLCDEDCRGDFIRVVSKFPAGTILPLMERVAGVFSNSASATYSYLSNNRTDNNLQPGADQPNSNPSATREKATTLSQTQSQDKGPAVTAVVFPTDQADPLAIVKGGVENATCNSNGDVTVVFTPNQLERLGIDLKDFTVQGDGSFRAANEALLEKIFDKLENMKNQPTAQSNQAPTTESMVRG